jgi:secondary thiamine-phosphate synthase enzyme
MPTQTAPLIHQQILTVQTQGKTLHNITRQVESVVADAGIVTGLCVVFVRHTSASLIIQENADPDVLRDLNHFFAKLVPEDGRSYIPSAEGPDDMPAHIRAAITKTSEQIPISNGRLVLGTWQGLYLWEHRQRSHRRQIVIHSSGLGAG